MAIPWLVVLQSVPWAQVITNAPKVAEGAKRLWNAVSNQPPPQVPLPEPSAGAEYVAALKARIEAMEIAADELHQQMLASSELIKTLADQNTELVRHIEANRVRVAWLTGATAVFGAIAVLSLALVLVQ